MAKRGARLEYVTPGRVIAPEVGPLTSPGCLRTFAEAGVTVTLSYSLTKVRRGPDNRLVAELYNEYAEKTVERGVDHVVVEHGTLPNDDLYFRLIPHSSNRGEVDYEAFVAIEPQRIARDPTGRFQLFRIGDAVAGRNIHAAIYDACRLGMTV